MEQEQVGRSPLRGSGHSGSAPSPVPGLGHSASVPNAPHGLLRALVAADIEREGPTSSTMVRAGLLADILDQHAELLEAGERLLAVFDQQRMTAAERIIVGVSDAGLRTEGNAAIEALRAAIAKATGAS